MNPRLKFRNRRRDKLAAQERLKTIRLSEATSHHLDELVKNYRPRK